MKPFVCQAGNLKVHGLPAFTDNILYVVEDTRQTGCTAIDPGDADVVLRFLQAHNMRLDWILITHHHADHLGGALKLATVTGAKIAAPLYDRDRLPFTADLLVSEGDRLNLGLWSAEVQYCPGHTRGHVIYWSPDEAVVFVGDLLFVGGCGRIFEGTFEELRLSLQRLLQLPKDTLFFCAHDYGPTNSRFLETILPSHSEVQKLKVSVMAAQRESKATMPFTLGQESARNPFLGQLNEELRVSLLMPKASDAQLFQEIRERRNRYS